MFQIRKDFLWLVLATPTINRPTVPFEKTDPDCPDDSEEDCPVPCGFSPPSPGPRLEGLVGGWPVACPPPRSPAAAPGKPDPGPPPAKPPGVPKPRLNPVPVAPPGPPGPPILPPGPRGDRALRSRESTTTPAAFA
ncbi:MAG: hypothetical protein DMG21_07770 [Acidobacteria bacterium]|nr:MAG: hypothetical protein DMG21_07770 [Acidobacteriota bacterium]